MNTKKDYKLIILRKLKLHMNKKNIIFISTKFLLLSILLILISTSSIFGNPFFSSNTEKDNSPQENIATVRTSKQNQEMVAKQRDLREKLGNFFYQLKENPEHFSKQKVFWQILLVSFLYGIIHAAGPGHRKTIVFSLYLTRNCKIAEPGLTGLALALLHGGTAIILMIIFSTISNSIAMATNNISIYLEGFSYILVILTAIFLLTKEIVDFIKWKKNKNHIQETDKNKKIELIPFLISGCYPCPGAILILVLSFTLKILSVGIYSVIAMSLGMAVPIIICGYLAYFGRTGLFKMLKQNETKAQILSFALESFGYILLIIFSLYIAMPFFTNFF